MIISTVQPSSVLCCLNMALRFSLSSIEDWSTNGEIHMQWKWFHVWLANCQNPLKALNGANKSLWKLQIFLYSFCNHLFIFRPACGSSVVEASVGFTSQCISSCQPWNNQVPPHCTYVTINVWGQLPQAWHLIPLLTKLNCILVIAINLSFYWLFLAAYMFGSLHLLA